VQVIDVYELLDAVRAIASTGLHYAENPYDRERYERLLDLAAREYAERSSLDHATVRARFDARIGYVSSNVGADAAVFDDDDRILLVRRVDDDRWGLVSGWVEPNESPRDTVLRELREEVGVEGRVGRLVGVFARPAHTFGQPHGTVSIVYLCEVVHGSLRPQPHEVHEVAYRAIDDVDDWHHNHEQLARAALESRWRSSAGI
jgi:ADP-ribose pyrophosphatase YjhB (NUDIX family)